MVSSWGIIIAQFKVGHRTMVGKKEKSLKVATVLEAEEMIGKIEYL